MLTRIPSPYEGKAARKERDMFILYVLWIRSISNGKGSHVRFLEEGWAEGLRAWVNMKGFKRGHRGHLWKDCASRMKSCICTSMYGYRAWDGVWYYKERSPCINNANMSEYYTHRGVLIWRLLCYIVRCCAVRYSGSSIVGLICHNPSMYLSQTSHCVFPVDIR